MKRRIAVWMLMAACCGSAGAATLQTAEEKAITGEIKSVDDGVISVETKGAAATVVKVPVADLVQITLTWQERIAATGATDGASAAPVKTAETKRKTPATNWVAAGTQASNTSSQPATQKSGEPKRPPQWRAEMGDGDRVTVAIAGWDDTGIKMTAASLNDGAFTVPVEQMRALWTTNELLAKKARDLNIQAAAGAGEAGGQAGMDVAYVEKDGEVKAVAGVALGADGEFLKFKYEDQERKIRLERLVGLVLAQREQPAAKEVYEVFTLSTGEVISGQLQGMEAGAFLVGPRLAGKGAQFRVPIGKLEKVNVRNGRIVWLGELTPTAVVQVPYFDRLIPYRVDHNLGGGTLTMTDGVVDRGIAVHTKCHLTYDLGGGFEKLRVKVGFAQPEGKLGRAALRIVGDEKVLWEEADLKGPSKPVVLDLKVDGVKSLRLEANFGKDQDVGDHVVWGDAKLIRAGAAK